MSSESLEYGSAAAAVAAGILTFIILGWLSIYGWLAAGLVAGLISRGSLRGTLSAVVSGAIVSGVIIALTFLVSPAMIAHLASYVGGTALTGDITGKLNALMTLKPVDLIRTLVISAIVIPAVGGFIGGSIHAPRSEYEYEEAAEVTSETS